MNLYNYQATILKIVDGDTIYFEIDMGIKTYVKKNCRLSGIDAAELRSPNNELKVNAQKAKEYLTTLLPIGTIVTIDSKKLDKWERPIVDVKRKDGMDVNKEMLDSGNAVVYTK